MCGVGTLDVRHPQAHAIYAEAGQLREAVDAGVDGAHDAELLNELIWCGLRLSGGARSGSRG